MARKFTNTRLLIASRNEGKVTEIKTLLAPYNIEIVSAKELDIQEPEETSNSFRGNAELKAKYYCKEGNLPALADDSGLSVNVLNGDPGIHSARWAGEPRDFNVAIQRIKDEIEDKNIVNPKASFSCALSLCWPDGHTETVEGQCHGTLTFPGRGEKGFGYDPIFVPSGAEQTFAEMEAEEKDRISHRAVAFGKLIEKCF